MFLDLFKDLIWDNWIEAALGRLFAASKFLSFGPVKAFIIWIVQKYSDQLFEVADEYFDIRNVIIKDEKLLKEYDRESVKLKLIARQYGIDSEVFRSSRAESRKKLSEFGRFNIPK